MNKKLIKYVSSLSGCNGGNIHSKIWFCGIEWGEDTQFNFDLNEFFYSDDFLEYIPYFDDEIFERYKDLWKSKVHLKICKILNYLEIKSKNPEDVYNFLLKKFCRQDGPIFKLNLFPFAFPKDWDSLWSFKHFSWTGLPTKETYRVFNIKYRFPFLKRIFIRYKPKILVCYGSGYSNYFKLAFSDADHIFGEPKYIELKSGKKIELVPGNPIILICPFLGSPKGINSDDELYEISDIMENLLKQDNVA